MDYLTAYLAAIIITALLSLILDRPRRRRIRFVSTKGYIKGIKSERGMER